MERAENFTTHELQLVVTARKIRQFKEIIAQQRALGATNDLLQPSIQTQRQLEQDFQRLSEQLLAVVI